jgi:hypothetical protein
LYEAGLIAKDRPILNISGSDLRTAYLSGAVLRGAILHKAKGWTEEQLTAARSPKGATMPNGQKYEDWLKSQP